MNNKYIPGVCNIGTAERNYRKNAGILAVALGILMFFAFYAMRVKPYLYLLEFIPIYTAAISFLQYKFHFCAEFGILGKYNFEDKIGRALTVNEKESLKLDRRKALKIILYSFAITLILTIALFFWVR